MEIYAAKFYVEFVKHTIVADAKFAFGPALQPFVGKIFQARSHFVNLALHRFADAGWQAVKRLGKSVRQDLERSGHGSFRLASRVIAPGDFAAGLIQLGLHVIGKFKLVFKKVINPRANFFNFSA